MKNKLLLSLFVGLAALLSVAQTPPTATESLVRIQAETTTGNVTAFFEKSVTVDSVVYRQPWESVSWVSSTKEVTVNGQTKTYGEVMQYVVAIANQERAEQLAPPAPLP